jgi:uncharacterized protein involved in exopolysaccharide biosynthesis
MQAPERAQQPPAGPTDEITIRFSDIRRFFRVHRGRISLVTGLFAGLGVVLALLAPVEYTSESQIMPELQGKSTIGQFQALADLAGINLDNVAVTDAVRPDLYPNILQSKPFLISLMALPVRPGGAPKPERLDGYLRRQRSVVGRTLNAVGSLFRRTGTGVPTGALPDSSGILVLSEEDQRLIEGLSGRVQAGLDKRTGLITVSAKMPDPVVAAVVARYALDYLTRYVVGYRTEKTRQQVEFLTTQVAQAKTRFQAADVALRQYRDQTRNPFFSITGAEETRRQSELTLSQTVYNDLARQLEQARVRMREETPVLKVLEPPQVPLKRSEPKRTVMVLGFALVGFIGSVLYWLGIKYVKENRER